MPRKKLNAKTAKKVFEAVLASDTHTRDMILEVWNTALDELRNEDGFGTEAQLDPRGDGRED